MSEPQSTDDLGGVIFDPIVRAKLKRIEEIAGFLLTAEQRASFFTFHQMHIHETYPTHIRKLKLERPKRFQQVLQGILGDVEQALAAVYYHRRNLANAEIMIFSEIEDPDFLARLKTSTVAVGNTAVLNFEYHALLLASRRCLDYLARAVGASFSLDVSSFRKMNAIQNSSPKQLATAVLRIHEACMPSLGRLVSESGEKSIRDVISHYRFIDAGALNINKSWSGIFGGPENLNKQPSRVPRQLLTEPVDRLCADVQRTVDGMLGTLFTEVTAE